MTANEMIAELQALVDQHGDLPIVGGYLAEDRTPECIIPLDSGGHEDHPSPVELFIT